MDFLLSASLNRVVCRHVAKKLWAKNKRNKQLDSNKLIKWNISFCFDFVHLNVRLLSYSSIWCWPCMDLVHKCCKLEQSNGLFVKWTYHGEHNQFKGIFGRCLLFELIYCCLCDKWAEVMHLAEPVSAMRLFVSWLQMRHRKWHHWQFQTNITVLRLQFSSNSSTNYFVFDKCALAKRLLPPNFDSFQPLFLRLEVLSIWPLCPNTFKRQGVRRLFDTQYMLTIEFHILFNGCKPYLLHAKCSKFNVTINSVSLKKGTNMWHSLDRAKSQKISLEKFTVIRDCRFQ